MRKTNRHYGQILATIRAWRGRGEFTVEALMPALTSVQARDNCRQLVYSGELLLIQPGRRGRFGFRRAVYKFVIPNS